MASDALFQMLAQAKAQPDRWARDLNAGVGALKDTAGGYMQGLQMRAERNEAALKPYEIWSKINDSAGPDVANSIFKQRGIPIPDVSGGASGVPRTPDQLATLGGTWANKQLTNQNTLGEMKKRDLDIENNQPFSPDVANFIGKGDMEGLTKYHADKGETVPYREVQQTIAAKRPQFMAGMVNLRGSQAVLGALPSHQPPGSPAGAASGVQLAARQGRALIANPSTSPQQIALASGDLARAVLRAAPQLDAMRGADYSNTLSGRLNDISQRLTSGKIDPKDLPEVRRQMYTDFQDLENSSRPLIARELAHTERTLGPQGFLPPDWEDMKKDELGLNLPDIPFNPGGSSQNPNISTGVPTVGGSFQGGKVLHVEKISQ